MNANEIIADIQRHREALARACGHDVKTLMNYYRRRERERPAAGHRLLDKVFPPAPEPASALREEPPKP